MAKTPRAAFCIDCRSIGPGGTYVHFYPTPEGLKAIWSNENCPYEHEGVTIDEDTYEASDGHNVSLIPWEDLERVLNNKRKGRR